jgi:hypothetical protein
MMGAGRIAMVAFGFVLAGAPVALAGADTEPVIVVPGRRDVPIMIDGFDVSGAVIEGEWGLARGHTGITIILPRHYYPWPYPWRARDRASWGPPVGHYYPGTGLPATVGRREVLPPANRALPPPAETYKRSWGTESPMLPPTVYPPYETPPVIIGPLRDGGRHGPLPPP